MKEPGRVSLPNHVLRGVERPGRYLGGEINAIRKRQYETNICLLFPDLYDVGISYYGFQILYHILNREPDLACERSYLPWSDMQRLMRQRRLPLFSLESRRPVREFDVVGMTLQIEYHYPGVVRALDLAGIPRRAIDRGPDDPIVIGGGPCAYHPEPIAPFFDAFFPGDGEDSIIELMRMLQSIPFRSMSRRELWERLAGLKGCYVPGLYGMNGDGRVVPRHGAPKIVRGRTVRELKPENYPVRPLIPLVKGTHDRLVVEIMRGCTQGCRFCQAGMIHRPVRERSPNEIADQVMAGLDATGFDEVGLLSLSTSDYQGIEQLILELGERLVGRRATLAFPSLRPVSFTEEIARSRSGGRRTTVTFALEAGSERLRRAISKHLDEDDLFAAVERAYRTGWKTVKLYLMTGLPTENAEDIDETVRLLKRLQGLVPRGRRLNVAVSPFIPKPQTPFERAAFRPMLEHDQARSVFAKTLTSHRTSLDWHGAEESLIEAVLARGDRRLAVTIERIADEGEGLESWSRCFSADRWFRALDETVPNWREWLEETSWDRPTAWDHLSKGVSRSFRRREWESALRDEPIADCRRGKCPACGLGAICQPIPSVSGSATVPLVEEEENAEREDSAFLEIDTSPSALKHLPRYRIEFAKIGRARMLGHHDLMRSVILALRRVGAPLVYHHGLQPRAILSFGPALPLGRGAARLWVDFAVERPVSADLLLELLRAELPHGIYPLKLSPVEGGKPVSNRYRFRFVRKLELFEAGRIVEIIAKGDPGARWSLDGAGYAILLDWGLMEGAPQGDRGIEERMIELTSDDSGPAIASSTWM